MIEQIADLPPGANGLICLPFLSGERAPYWNANARGIFLGVGLYHQRSHFIRAVLEGILFNVYNITQALTALVPPAQEIRASGGFARSQRWLQMMSDIFGATVVVPAVFEASGLGAATLAMYATGQLSQLEDIATLIEGSDSSPEHQMHHYQPDPSLTQRYSQIFQIYQQLYHNQTELFQTLATLRAQDL
jgi:gluconokinase